MHPGRLIAFMTRHLRGLAASTTRYAPTSTRGSPDSGARAGPIVRDAGISDTPRGLTGLIEIGEFTRILQRLDE